MLSSLNWNLLYLPLGLLIVALSVLCLMHALLRARHPQSALGWALVIVFVPLLGPLAYFMFGINRVDSRAAKLMSKAMHKRRQTLRKQEPPPKRDFFHAACHPQALDLMRVADCKKGSSALLGGNRISPLINGDQAYPAMLQAIDAAKYEVFLCTYMFEGQIWGAAFAQAMLRAAKRGVDVRVLVDGIGTWKRDRPWKALIKAGIPVQRFLPPRLLPPQFSINLRMHRKVLICDGTGFTGGINIADFNIQSFPDRRTTQDLHFCCKGPIVGALRESFLMDWAFVTEESQTSAQVLPDQHGHMDCRMVMDGTGSSFDPLLELYCGVISCARQRLVIFTPYFLPPPELAAALYSAVDRGVQVSLILPEHSDHYFVDWAVEHALLGIVEHGITVYKQPPPFAHTKLLLIDDLYTCLGSTNLDPRSLSLNFELNLEVFSMELNAELSAYTLEIIKRSHKMSLYELLSKPMLARLRNAALWIFSPYL